MGKLEFDANKITKLKLNTSAFNLRLVGKEGISNIICKLENIDKDWVEFNEDGDTLRLTVTEKGSTLKTIWQASTKRTVKIAVPIDKTFESMSVKAGVGLTRLKRLKTEKLSFSSGVGFGKISNLAVNSQCKLDGGVGRLLLKNCTLANVSLKCGVGLVEISGSLLGNSSVLAGVGKVELNIDGDPADYKVTTQSTFLDNIQIDGIFAKNYTNPPNTDAAHSILLSGGVGSISLNFIG